MAADLSLEECAASGKTDLRRLRAEWKIEPGHCSSRIQRQRTLDLESVCMWTKEGHLVPLNFKVKEEVEVPF